MRFPSTPPANPGASSTATLFDSDVEDTPGPARKPQPTKKARFRASVFTNVADATFIVEQFTATAPRTVYSYLIPANTYFERDVLLLPGRTLIRVATVTAPSTWEVVGEIIDDQALAQ